jgi:hypothetical protein
MAGTAAGGETSCSLPPLRSILSLIFNTINISKPPRADRAREMTAMAKTAARFGYRFL